MIPAGFLAKRIAIRPDWLASHNIEEVCSVSGCVSANFADYIPLWKHNGWWLFDSEDALNDAIISASVDPAGLRTFYYEVHEFEQDIDDSDVAHWRPVPSSLPFDTRVKPPQASTLLGYDVVTFSLGSGPECSPLSCNRFAESVAVNRHCLLESMEAAIDLLNGDTLQGAEPGPYRIFAVYAVEPKGGE